MSPGTVYGTLMAWTDPPLHSRQVVKNRENPVRVSIFLKSDQKLKVKSKVKSKVKAEPETRVGAPRKKNLVFGIPHHKDNVKADCFVSCV